MPFLSLSTDQVATFIELARCGSLRHAAAALHTSAQRVRNRMVVLEQRIGAELYRKSRGPRTSDPLTPHGHEFLPRAMRYLEAARGLTERIAESGGTDEIQ